MSTRLREGLQRRREASLLRQRLTLDTPQAPLVRVDGRQLISFCSNDYLGLANHPRLVESLRDAALQYGVGSGASHLVVGHLSPHRALEDALAAHTGRERALLFSSGFLANLGVITTLVGQGDHLFQDKLNHASLIDGGRLSGARFRRFPHNDLEILRNYLQRCDRSTGRLVAVDGVYSMDGDSAPLPQMAALCAGEGAWLMVDDAHGFGVLGERGAGSLEACGLSPADVPVLMGTLGKALGTAGAFVAGSHELVEALVQNARSYIYTTALPPALAAATLTALRLLEEEGWRRARWRELVAFFRRGARQLELPVLASSTPIQPLLVGNSARAVAISDGLRQQGFLVTAIRPPTVPTGSARLRITVSAAHTEDQLEHLLTALSQLIKL